MRIAFFLILLNALLFCNAFVFSQERSDSLRLQNKAARVVFYNVENLFDIYDDSTKNDNEYLPTAKKQWNEQKYWQKQNNIAKTLIAVGGVETPDIIGLCEIENQTVLKDLTQTSPLKNSGYVFLHKESKDRRGIDVACLYKPTSFKLLYWQAIQIKFNDPHHKTRDILYVKGILLKTDTIHLFINHWPSRVGGIPKTEPLRMEVAKILKQKTDSLQKKNKNALIIIMGDLNDDPINNSIIHGLNAFGENDSTPTALYNLSYPIYKRSEGSLVFKDKIGWRWCMFDQIIVSSALYQAKQKLFTAKEATVFKAPFLLEKSKNGLIEKPKRTYQGPIYKAGFSDHLPVYVDVIIK